jgi:hypothetical protein
MSRRRAGYVNYDDLTCYHVHGDPSLAPVLNQNFQASRWVRSRHQVRGDSHSLYWVR